MEWARAALNLDEETVVSVTGNQCGDPECGGAETVILLMQPDQTDQPRSAIKISESIETTEADTCAPLSCSSPPRA